MKVEVTCIGCNRIYKIGKEAEKVSLRKKGFIKCNGCSVAKWSEPKILIEALKYNTKIEFHDKSYSAYRSAKRLKILDRICEHMKPNIGGQFYKLKNLTGIYFLLYKSKTVYIGKSNECISARVRKHLHTSDKVFDEVVAYCIEGDSDINIAEMYLINKLKPKYNKGDIGESKVLLIIPNIDDIIEEEITIKNINKRVKSV